MAVGLNTPVELCERVASLINITTCHLTGWLFYWRLCFWTATLIDQAAQCSRVSQVALSEAHYWLNHHQTPTGVQKMVAYKENASTLAGCMASHDITRHHHWCWKCEESE